MKSSKNRPFPVTFWICHAMAVLLLICVFLPGQKEIKGIGPMLVAMACIQGLYLLKVAGKQNSSLRAASDLMIIIWGFLLVWEIAVTKQNLMHPVLVPAPENVFYVFYDHPLELLQGVWSSLRLLFIGILVGVSGGVLAGMVCGWVKRLRELFHPIANVLAPIPAIVFSPYIVAIMPTFRSASAVVIILGIFWPTFLNMMIRVDAIDSGILDSAKMLHLSNGQMIFQIILPYIFPGVIRSLKVTLTTGVTLLTFAEMMGATSGMGYFIVNYNTYGNYTYVIAGIIVVGIVVTLLNLLAFHLERKLIKWK